MKRLPLFSLLACLLGLASVSRADLTVTVQENYDGSATISLSGSSSVVEGYPSIITVAANFSDSIPPVSFPPPQITLPVGLSLVADGVPYPVDFFLPSGTFRPSATAWVVGSFNIFSGASVIVGKGSVRVESFPFSALVPGTFRVEAYSPSPTLPDGSAPDEVGAEVPTGPGLLPYTTVYRVLPFEPKPDISAKAPRVIRTLRGRRGKRMIVVKNTGNVPLNNVALSARSNSFLLGKPIRTTLMPGRSTRCPIFFLGRTNSTATVRVSGSTADRQVVPVRIPDETVSTTVRVRGVAVNLPTRATRPSKPSHPLIPRWPARRVR